MLLHDIHFICYNVNFRGSFKTIITFSETVFTNLKVYVCTRYK